MDDIIINPVRANVIPPVQKPNVSDKVVEKTIKNEPENMEKEVGDIDKIALDLSKAVEKVKEFVTTFSTKLTFDIDPESDKPVIYVRDQETGKVIRQIPPDEMVRIGSNMDEITGILFNRRV